jgi:putative membrane protein
MNEEHVIWDAEFNDRVTQYWLLSGALVLVCTVAGIVLLPIWFIVGLAVTRQYLKGFRCTLTNRSLKVAKGVFVRVEKTVPLDRITDVGLVQGPVMRMFDIEALSIETAGQSSQGSLVQLAGIKDGRKFRDAVLKQRELVVGSAEDRPAAAVAAGPVVASGDGSVAVLESIRDTLLRIERQLGADSR